MPNTVEEAMIFTDGDKIAAAILAAAQLVETRSQAVLESDYRKALELVISLPDE